jgi:hypothetical protein
MRFVEGKTLKELNNVPLVTRTPEQLKGEVG